MLNLKKYKIESRAYLDDDVISKERRGQSQCGAQETTICDFFNSFTDR